MKPHLFVKGKAITLKSAVYLSNTQSTSRTIAMLPKRWEAPHALVCPTDTQTLWLEETMKHFNRQENKNNMQCPNPPSNLLSGPPFKDLLSETPLVILQCVSSLSSHSSFVYCSHRVLYTTCCRVTEKKNGVWDD